MRPSSLNYKISLSEAVSDFNAKDMPTQEDQYIDVVLEEPKTGGGGSSKSNNHEPDELDDVLFDMTVQLVRPVNTRSKNNHP